MVLDTGAASGSALVVVGTRPDAIKLAPIVIELRKRCLPVLVAATGQHRELLDQVLTAFDIIPDVDLSIMKHGQTLVDITCGGLVGIDAFLETAEPRIVIVQGDTSTSFAAALAAFYRQIPVAHVEAGLRSHNRYEPFPEEMNRLLIGRLASIHFAPTQHARTSLLREGTNPRLVHVTGNTGIDALLLSTQGEAPVPPQVSRILESGRRLVLVTAHRRESWGEPICCIARAVLRIAATYTDVECLVMLHKNPRVRDPLTEMLAGAARVTCVDAMEYRPFCRVLGAAYLVLTDSGGIQEEAPTLGIPVLVLRDVTERPEGVDAGTARVVGTREEQVFEEASRLLSQPDAHLAMARATNPYGDGHASARIVDALMEAGAL